MLTPAPTPAMNDVRAPAIFFAGEFFSPSEVVKKIRRAMWAGDNSSAIVGVNAGVNIDGVIITMAAIHLGLPVAICPLREPQPVIDEWLKSLGVTKMLPVMPDAASSPAYDGPSRLEQFASIIRTSGSTGVPKSAIISADAHRASARSVCDYFSLNQDACFGLNLPLYHVSGLSIIFRAMTSDCKIFIAPDYQSLVDGISSRIITHVSLVPSQLQRLLQDGVDLSHLQAVIMGGDAMPLELCRHALSCGLKLFSTYGLTETASMVYIYDEANNQGRTLPHAQIKISSQQEITVKSSSLFSGYMGEIAHHQGAPFATGDLGYIDDGGRLWVSGRKCNRIISGGENIQAEEIERFLEQHPQIERAVVVAAADEIYGQRPKAYIKWHSKPLTSAELKRFLGAHVAKFKLPQAFATWPQGAPATEKKARSWFKAHQERQPF